MVTKYMNKVIIFLLLFLTFVGMYLKQRVSTKSLIVRLHLVERFFNIHKAGKTQDADTYTKYQLSQT